MHAFLKFNKGIMRLPLPWRLWMVLLVALNLVVPLFFFDRLEAQVVLVTMAVSMFLMTGLTAVSGFSRLLGLGHIAWIPNQRARLAISSAPSGNRDEKPTIRCSLGKHEGFPNKE